MARIEQQDKHLNVLVNTRDGEKTVHGCCSQSGSPLSVVQIVPAEGLMNGTRSIVTVSMLTFANPPQTNYEIYSIDGADDIRKAVQQVNPNYVEQSIERPRQALGPCPSYQF